MSSLSNVFWSIPKSFTHYSPIVSASYSYHPSVLSHFHLITRAQNPSAYSALTTPTPSNSSSFLSLNSWTNHCVVSLCPIFPQLIFSGLLSSPMYTINSVQMPVIARNMVGLDINKYIEECDNHIWHIKLSPYSCGYLFCANNKNTVFFSLRSQSM